MLILFLLSLFGLLFLNVPVAFSLAGSALIMMISQNTISFEIIPQSMIRGIDSFTLLAIPFFLLAGEIMNKGGLSKRIVRFSQSVIGFVTGGLGYVSIIASMIFAGISGSAIADTSAMGSILFPIMKEEGYKMPRVTALVASAGTIGPIIPPSIPMILYGVVAGVSIVRLFLGGAIPGLLIGIAIAIVWRVTSKKDNMTKAVKISFKQIWASFKESILALVMPIIILGGIIGGICTPTEAAVIAVVYAFIIATFVYKEFTFKDIVPVCITSAKGTAIVMLVCGAATAAAYFITIAQIPAALSSLLLSISSNKYVILFLINILLLIVGMVMDLTPALLILAPILLPVVTSVGIDPVFFGVVMVINLCIGLLTPPVGTVLFTACGISKEDMTGVISYLWPYLLAMIAVLFLVTYVPILIMWLPNLILGS